MIRILDHDLILVGVKNYDFVQACALLPHFVEDLAPKKEKHLILIKLSLKAISALEVFSICMKLWLHDIPFAVGIAMY